MMHFNLTYQARDLAIRTAGNERLNTYEDSDLFLDYGGPHHIVVQVRNLAEETLCIACEAKSRFEPNPRVRTAFESLSEKKLPEGSEIPGETTYQINSIFDDAGNLKTIPPLSFLPSWLEDFIGQTGGELSEVCKKTVGLLRWRGAIRGPHNPFFNSRFEWSLDGLNWNPMPTEISGQVYVAGSTVHLFDNVRGDIENLISEGIPEPTAHDLLREAWVGRNENLRSALVIGVAALEIGFKEVVADLVPHASWMVANLSSPPVVTMLKEYLPQLPVRNKVDGKVLSPPEDILAIVKKAVAIRNRVTHTSGTTLRRETIEETLLAIEDVLWLLDYYRGFQWAFEHIRPETRSAMQF